MRLSILRLATSQGGVSSHDRNPRRQSAEVFTFSKFLRQDNLLIVHKELWNGCMIRYTDH